MTHPLVDQLRFARSEFRRCLRGVSAEDGEKRLWPMNSISWTVGHMANQEQFYWVAYAQGVVLAPELDSLVGFKRPASTPPLKEMLDVWQTITSKADQFLETLETSQLETHLEWKGRPTRESIGTMLLRNIYHYWFHTGEAHAVRQQLGHPDLPQFVGNMQNAAFRAR